MPPGGISPPIDNNKGCKELRRFFKFTDGCLRLNVRDMKGLPSFCSMTYGSWALSCEIECKRIRVHVTAVYSCFRREDFGHSGFNSAL